MQMLMLKEAENASKPAASMPRCKVMIVTTILTSIVERLVVVPIHLNPEYVCS